MGRKKTNPGDYDIQENDSGMGTIPELEPEEHVETHAVTDPEKSELVAPTPKTPPVPKPGPTVVVPQKRIRFRPSQKKKLSVAVLCTNPMTRRFI